MRKPTKEEAFLLRRAAAVLNTTMLYKDYPESAAQLCRIADELDAPYVCEACDEPAVEQDSEGIGLCASCMSSPLTAE